jgi:hypothetical protein
MKSMNTHLIACPRCTRHIRANEDACPFCQAQNIMPSAAKPTPTKRIGRAALFAFGAAVSTTVALSGCGDSTEPTPDAATEAGMMDGGAAPPYGTPPDDAGPAPAYGAPPPDAGGPAPPYGTPPDDGG